MKNLTIGTILHHPMSFDILKFEIIEVQEITTQSGSVRKYKAKAVKNVGACGKVEIILKVDKFGYLVFDEFAPDENCPYLKDLYSFVDGKYYEDEVAAKFVFYNELKNLSKKK